MKSMIVPFLKVLKKHNAILNIDEKKYFILLTGFFLITSVLDIAGIGAIGAFLLLMMNPSLLSTIPVIDKLHLFTPNQNHLLIFLSALILSSFTIKTLFGCIVQKKLIHFCLSVGARIRVKLTEQYMFSPYSFFLRNNTSDLVNRVITYAHTYSAVGLVSFVFLVVHSIFILSVVTFLLFIHPWVTCLLIAFFYY